MLEFQSPIRDIKTEAEEHRYWLEANLKQFPKPFHEKLKALNYLVTSLQLLDNQDEIEVVKKSIDNILNIFTYNGCNPVYLGARNGYYIQPSAQMKLQRLPIFMSIYENEPNPASLLPPLFTNDYEELRNSAITPKFKSQLKSDSKPFIPQHKPDDSDGKPRETANSLYMELKRSR